MRVSQLILGLVAGLALTGVQAQVTDTRDASSPGPGATYFATVANQSNFPYYRYDAGGTGDWGWTHNAMGVSFSTASLSIGAFDVDAGPNFSDEVDNIYALDSGTWTLLGSLAGNNGVWAYTTFALGGNFYDDIANGLQVKMDIDVNHGNWAVALSKSVLSLDNGRLPPAVPAVPEPETYAMMLAGLGLITAIARRRKANKSV